MPVSGSTEARDEPRISVLSVFFFTLSATWAAWYVWRFKISPALNPREPKQKPYWIPFVGHAVGMFRDSDGTCTQSRKYFQDSRRPFALTVAGQTLYILTSSHDAAKVYKNTTTLTFDEWVRNMMSSFGTSDEGVRKVFENTTMESAGPNRIHRLIAHAGEDFYRQQFHPGGHLEDLWPNIQRLIEASLAWEGIPKDCQINASGTTKTLSLLRWCRTTLLCSVTTAVFGHRLLEIDPGLHDAFVTFDDDSWMFHYKIPRRFCEDMHTARERIVYSLTTYFMMPQEERSDATWLVKILEAETRNVELSNQDIAALLGTAFWVINGNAFKLCFWIFSYLLFDSSLFSAVRAEVDQIMSPGSIPQAKELESRLEGCNTLVAIYYEMLRFNTASATVRSVAAPTHLDDVTLGPNSNVLIPYRQLHFDESVFGANAAEFDPGRFLRNPQLSKSPSFRPFGGGTTYCAGRHVAKREVLGFVAMTINRYKVELAGSLEAGKTAAKNNQSFPRCDEKKPCLGVFSPVKGDDLEVTISERI